MNSPEGKYKRLKVADLRKILTERGIDSKGLKKDELIVRCIESDSPSAAKLDAENTDVVTESEQQTSTINTKNVPVNDESESSAPHTQPTDHTTAEPHPSEEQAANTRGLDTDQPESVDEHISDSLKPTADTANESTAVAEHDTVGEQTSEPSQTISKQESSAIEPIESQDNLTAESIETQEGSAIEPIESQDKLTAEPIETQESSANEPIESQDTLTAEPIETQESNPNEPIESQDNLITKSMNSQEIASTEPIVDYEATEDKPSTMEVDSTTAPGQADKTSSQDVEQVERKPDAATDLERAQDAGESEEMEIIERRVVIGPRTPEAEEPMEDESTSDAAIKPTPTASAPTPETSTGGVFSLLTNKTVRPESESVKLARVEESKPVPKKEWKYDPRPVVMENTDWVARETVELDRFHCDLNINITEDGYSCKPLSRGGFGYMWAGARANYGVSAPCSVAFQVKITGDLPTNIREQPFGSNYVARVGWSIGGMDYQVGDTPLSFAYQSTGRCCSDAIFVDYGESYGIGDVITCYLEISDTMVTVSFSKNDGPVVEAYKLESHLLGLNSLYPHISTKNFTMDVNFGQLERPWYPINEDYTMITELPVESRDRAVKPPTRKSECSVYLMVGMVGAGKSHWVAKTVAEQPEKRWNIIGTPELLSKMKMEGMETSDCYTGRWDDLYDKTNTCLKKLLSVAATRLRNYIIDQTNVYEGAQCRKVRPFKGFTRKAVVIIPSNEVYQQRLEARNKATNKIVHNDAILEMKANLTIPVAGAKLGKEHSFHEVEFVELKGEEVAELVAKYNAEGQVRFKKIAKQYHKRELKAQKRKDDLAKQAQKKAQREAKKSRGRGRGRGGTMTRDYHSMTLDEGNDIEMYPMTVNRGGHGGMNGVGGMTMQQGSMMGGNRMMGGPMRGGMAGNMMRGGMMRGGIMRGGMMRGGMMRGGMVRGAMGSGGMNINQATAMQNNMGQTGMGQTGMGQAGMGQSGMGQAGMAQGGMGQAGMAQGGMGQAGMAQSGMGQAGIVQGGMGQASMIQSSMGQAGTGRGAMGQAGIGQSVTSQNQRSGALNDELEEMIADMPAEMANQMRQMWTEMQSTMTETMRRSLLQSFQSEVENAGRAGGGATAGGDGYSQGGNWNNQQQIRGVGSQQQNMNYNQGNNMMTQGGGMGGYQQQYYNQGYNQGYGGGGY